MTSWPIVLLLAFLALEGALLVTAPGWVHAMLRELTVPVVRIVGAVELVIVLLIVLALAAG